MYALDVLLAVIGGLQDAAFIIDQERAVVGFNRQFFLLFPKTLARRLKGRPIDALLRLEVGGEELDIAEEVYQRRTSVRYDEIQGYVTDGPNLSLIVSAIPLWNWEDEAPSHEIWGALGILRDVTDLAQVQAKYQKMLGGAEQRSEMLERTIREQGQRILELGDELNRLQEELMGYRKRLLL